MTSIDEFIPYRDQYFEAITNAMKFGSPMENLSKIHRFLKRSSNTLIQIIRRADGPNGTSTIFGLFLMSYT